MPTDGHNIGSWFIGSGRIGDPAPIGPLRPPPSQISTAGLEEQTGDMAAWNVNQAHRNPGSGRRFARYRGVSSCLHSIPYATSWEHGGDGQLEVMFDAIAPNDLFLSLGMMQGG